MNCSSVSCSTVLKAALKSTYETYISALYRAYRVEVEWLKTTDFLPKVTGSKPCVHKIGTGFAAKPGGSRHGGMEVTEQGHPLGGGDGAVTVRAGPVLHAREMTKTKRVDRRRIGSRISQGLPRG